MYGHPPPTTTFTEACDPLPYHHHRNNAAAGTTLQDDNLIHNKQHPQQQPPQQQQQQQQQYYGGRYRSMSSNNFDHLTSEKMLRISPLLIDCNQNIDTRRNDPPQQQHQKHPSSSHSLHHQHQRNFADHKHGTATRGTPVVGNNEHQQQQQRCSSNNVVIVDAEKYATGVCRMATAGNSRNEYFISSTSQPHSVVQGRPPAANVAATVAACRNPPRWASRENDQYNYQYHYYQQQHQQQQQANQRIMLLNEQARRLSPLSSSTFGPGQSCFNERPGSRWMLSQEGEVQQHPPAQQQQATVATSYHCVVGNNETTRSSSSSRQDETTTKRKKLAMYKVTTQLRQLRMDLNQIRSSTMDFKREIEADFARLNSIIANNTVVKRKTTTGSDSATNEALIPPQQTTPPTDPAGNQIQQQRYEQKSDLLQLPNKCNRVDDVSSRLSSLSGADGSPPSRCSTSSLPMTVANLLETPDHVSMIGRAGIQPGHQESECSVDSGYQDQFGSILMSRASGVPLHSPIVETPPVKSDNSAATIAETTKEKGHHQSFNLTAPPSGSCYRNEAWLEAMALTSPHASSEWLDISQVISPEVDAATDRRDSAASQVRPVPKERKTLKKSKSDIAAMGRSNDAEMLGFDTAKNVRTSTSSADNTTGSSSKKDGGNHRITSPSAQQQQRKIKLGVSAISVANKTNQKESSVKNQQIKKAEVDNDYGDGKEAVREHERVDDEKKTEVKEETHQQQEVIRRRSMRMMTELQIYELDELGFTRPVVENVTTNPGKKTKDSSKKDSGTDGQKKRKSHKKRDEYAYPCSTSPPTIVDNPQSMVISQSWDIYRVGSPEDVRRPRARLPHAFSLSPNQQYTSSVESPQPLPRKSTNQLIGGGSSARTTPSSRIVSHDVEKQPVKEAATARASSSAATNAFVGASVMSAFSPVLSTSLFSLNSLGENDESTGGGGNFKRRTSLPLSSRKSQFYDQHVRPLVAEMAKEAAAAPMMRGAGNKRADGKGNDSRKSRRSHPARQRHQSAEEDLRSEASLYQHQQQQQRYGHDYCTDNRTGYNDGGFPQHARTLSAFVTPTNAKELVQRKLPKYHELPVKRCNEENGMPEHNSRVAGNSSTEAVSDRKQHNRFALTASIANHTYQRENGPTGGSSSGYESKGVTKSSASSKHKTTSAVSSMFKANFISRKMKGSGDQSSLRKSYNPRDRSSTASTSSTETPASVSSKLKSKAPPGKLKKSFYTGGGGGGGKKVSSSSYGDVDSSFEEPLTATKTQSTKSRGAMQRIRNSFRNPRQKTKMFGGGAAPAQQPHSISEHQNSSSSRRRDEHEVASRTNLGIQLFLDPHKSASTQQQQQQQSSVAHPSGNISYV